MLATARPQAQVALLGQPLDVLLGAGVVFAGRLLAHVGSDLVGRDELLVLVQDRAAEAALLDDDGGQDEPGPDLDEANVRLLAAALAGLAAADLLVALLALGRLDLVDLVVAHPDLAVGKGETHDAVDEGL